MSKVPSTLEEVQYEVLQGDLTINPKLQPSPIPAKDKELKTTAKKIIPAINELVKLVATCKQSVDTYSSQIEDKVNVYGEVLGNTLKKEQLEAIESKVSEIEEGFKEVLAETSETLKNDYALAMDEKMIALEKKIEAIVLEQMKKTGSQVGGNELKREFISSAELLQTGAGCQAPFKLQEVQDFNRQVEVLAYSSKYNAYIRVNVDYALESSSTSIYEAYSRPITTKVADDGTITLVSADSRKLKVYFYNLV